MLYDNKKLINAIEEIKHIRNCDYQDIAKEIGITPAFFSQVRHGKKFFSYDTFLGFCKKFGYELEYFQPDNDAEVVPFKVGNVLSYWMNIKKIPISKLAELTDIDMFELFDFASNNAQPTLNQLNSIAKALEVDQRIFDVRYDQEFAKIKKSLEDVFALPKDQVDVIINFIEKHM